jgi:hypothetical protein
LAGQQVLAAALGAGEGFGVDLAEAVVEVEQVLVDLDLPAQPAPYRGSEAELEEVGLDQAIEVAPEDYEPPYDYEPDEDVIRGR